MHPLDVSIRDQIVRVRAAVNTPGFRRQRW